MKEIVIRMWPDATIAIDAETSIQIRVKRLDVFEAGTFERLLQRAVTSYADLMLLDRRTEEERAIASPGYITASDLEDAKARMADITAMPDSVASGQATLNLIDALLEQLRPRAFVITDNEIRRRRFLDMTDEQRARYERHLAMDEAAGAKFVAEALGAFVKVLPGQLVIDEADGTETPVLTGAQLVRCYSGRVSLLKDLVAAIRHGNDVDRPAAEAVTHG